MSDDLLVHPRSIYVSIDIPLGLICFSRTKVMCICMLVYRLYCIVLCRCPYIRDFCCKMYTVDHLALNGKKRSGDTACL
jgi:hypothetical protein